MGGAGARANRHCERIGGVEKADATAWQARMKPVWFTELGCAAIDKGGSVFLTFWPTEFSQVRGQFRHISFAEGVRANEFLMQFNFSIGAHAAHVF